MVFRKDKKKCGLSRTFLLAWSGFNSETNANDVGKIDTTKIEQPMDVSTVQAATVQSEAVAPSTEEIILTYDQVDEKPEYIGSSFSYNGNIHIENGAPGERYEVKVTYIVEADGSISNILFGSAFAKSLLSWIIFARSETRISRRGEFRE